MICLAREVSFVTRSGSSHRLYHCHSCDVMFWWPLGTPDADWYEEHYYYICRDYSPSAKLAWYHRRFFDSPPLPAGKLLEVGCSTGEFLAAAQKKGYRVTGLELNRRSVEFARRIHGLQSVHALTLESYVQRFPEARFDIVAVFEVVEHLINPKSLLQQVRQVVNSGGSLVLSVPNRNRWLRCFGNQEWDIPPHHFTRWSKQALSNILTEEGFAVQEVTEAHLSCHTVAADLSRMIRLGVARRMLESTSGTAPDQVQGTVHKAALLYRVKEHVMTAFALPLVPLLKVLGEQGPTLYASAKVHETSAVNKNSGFHIPLK